MLKVVIDTNVFVAGLLSTNSLSCSAQIISMWRAGGFTLVMSPQILHEIVAKLIEKGIEESLIEDFVTTIGKVGLRIPGAYETSRLDKIDPDDNMFLAASFESKADFLVSLDRKSLIPLKHFHGTQIVMPELFMRNIFDVAPEDESNSLQGNELEDELTALSEETWRRRQESTPEDL